MNPSFRTAFGIETRDASPGDSSRFLRAQCVVLRAHEG
jgi:hypothetical protein